MAAYFADPKIMNAAVTNRMIRLILIAASLAVLPACTWVKPTVSAENVRVAYDSNVSGCRDAGAISVSVTAKVAFYHRSGLKVRDELETLARNQAAGIPADTIKAIDEPKDGAQNFQAYVCGGVRVKQRDDAGRAMPHKSGDEAQTFPIKDH
jgi:Domain of unknown function (DUF4156)